MSTHDYGRFSFDINIHPTRQDMLLVSGKLYPYTRNAYDVGDVIGKAMDTIGEKAEPGCEVHSIDIRTPRRKPSGSIGLRHTIRVTLRRPDPA